MSRMLCGLLILLSVVLNVNAQDSLGMRRVSALEYWQAADDIQMVGNLAYVVSGSSGLFIMDLSDAAQPAVIGHASWYAWDDIISGVFVTGNLAYVTAGTSGFVFDLTDPTHPEKIGEWEEGGMEEIYVYGEIGIGVGEGYPIVLDVHDPASIHRIGEFPGLFSYTQPIGMAGDYLCMTGLGLSVWDMTFPAHPVQVATADTLFSARYGTLLGNYAYLASWQDGLRILDVSNPLQPMEVAACDSGWCYNVSVTDSHAVIVKGYGVDIWNITNPLQPVFEGMLTTGVEMPFDKVSSSNNRFCVSVWHDTVAALVVDMSNPTIPSVVSSFGRIGALQHFAVNGTTGYVADSHRALRTIDLSNPEHLTEFGTYSGNCRRDVAVRGNYAYLVDYNDGLVTYDIINSALPESLNSIDPGEPFHPMTITVDGDYAYVDGLQYIFSLQDSAAPQLLGSASIPQIEGMKISNWYLYCGVAGSGNQHWFKVYGMHNPTSPQLVAACSLSEHAATGGIGVIEVTDRYACVAGSEVGLWLVDISDLTHPFEVAWHDGCRIKAMAASGNTLFSGGRCGIINVLDLTDPLNPNTVGYYSTDENIRAMHIQGQYLMTLSLNLFSAYQVDALTAAVEPSVPQSSSLDLTAYPNPFNSNTQISFTLPQETKASLVVYDVLGRIVAVPQTETLFCVGTHHLTFDGSELVSGTYYLHLKTNGLTKTQKLILLK